MKCDKYMGLDVHQATTVVAVKDAEGKLILETIVPTEATAMRRLVGSFSGPLHVTLEETTQGEVQVRRSGSQNSPRYRETQSARTATSRTVSHRRTAC